MVKRGAHNPKTVIALSRFESWVRYKKNTKYFHKYLDISNFFVIFVLLSSLISLKKYKGGFLILPVSFGRKEKDNQ